MGILKPKKPRPVAYCWLYYHEMSARQVQINRCRDPVKQSQNPGGICKWLQMYGDQGSTENVQIRSIN
jgi:hypothetical protein